MKKTIVLAVTLLFVFAGNKSVVYANENVYGDVKTMIPFEGVRSVSDVEKMYVGGIINQFTDEYIGRAMSLVGKDTFTYINDYISTIRVICHAFQDFSDFDLYRRTDLVDANFQRSNLRVEYIVSWLYDELLLNKLPQKYEDISEYMLVICREYNQDNIKDVKFKKGDVLVFDDKNIAICINDAEVVMGRDSGAVVKQINEHKDWNTLRRFRIDIKEEIKDSFVIYTNAL